jgi:hypothetical protein
MPNTVVTGVLQAISFDPPKGRVAFERAEARAVDFRRTSWDLFWVSESVFVDCDFREARFSTLGFQAVLGAFAGKTVFQDCRFDAADLRNVNPGAARFERCRFDGARIEHWLSFYAEFVDCHFAGRIAATTFSGRPWGPGAEALRPRRSLNEFRGNDFREVDLVDCSFVRGINLDLQLLPSGNDYVRFDRAPERIARAKDQVSDWTESVDRKAALVMLEVYSTGGYKEQEQILARRYGLVPTISHEVTDRVWALIEEH